MEGGYFDYRQVHEIIELRSTPASTGTPLMWRDARTHATANAARTCGRRWFRVRVNSNTYAKCTPNVYEKKSFLFELAR